MKRVKALAKRWGDRGEEFTAEDLKLHLNLGVSTRTIAKALKKKGGAKTPTKAKAAAQHVPGAAKAASVDRSALSRLALASCRLPARRSVVGDILEARIHDEYVRQSTVLLSGGEDDDEEEEGEGGDGEEDGEEGGEAGEGAGDREGLLGPPAAARRRARRRAPTSRSRARAAPRSPRARRPAPGTPRRSRPSSTPP